jgi:hypothetical protein
MTISVPRVPGRPRLSVPHRGDDLVPVRVERALLVVALQVHRELVYAERTQLGEPLDVRLGRARGRRTGRRSRPRRNRRRCWRSDSAGRSRNENPLFDDAERAALALAEAATRLADRPGAVTDEIWAEAAKHYDERQLGALVLMVAITNFFNRLNTTFRIPAGTRWD